MGCGVTRRISAIKASANAGEPSASTATTPSSVTTKPAFEMKLRLADVPRAACPCTIQTPGATLRAVCAAVCAAVGAASPNSASAASQNGIEARTPFASVRA